MQIFVDNFTPMGQIHFSRGAVAQLGERLNGIQEAVSSILSSSTRKIQGLTRNRESFFRGKSRGIGVIWSLLGIFCIYLFIIPLWEWLDTVYTSYAKTFSQRAMQRICTAATNEVSIFAYRVATPLHCLRWRKVFLTKCRTR